MDQMVEDIQSVAKRIELPYFRGEDPFGWISRAEAFFTVQGTPPALRLEFAHISMEGPPWHWFKMLKEEDPLLDWEKFKTAFFYRYGGHCSGNLYMQLRMMKQRGSVDEFIEEFDMVASQLTELTNEQYLGLFMGGLKEEIRVKL